jgi:hypothetical protein
MSEWLPAAQVQPFSLVFAAQGRRQASSLSDDPAMRMILPVGRSGLAIAAGYLGLIAIFAFPAPLALLCGLLAVRDIRDHPEKRGMGRAVFGIVMGAIGTVLLVVVLKTMAD